jgi:hypothetical protein
VRGPEDEGATEKHSETDGSVELESAGSQGFEEVGGELADRAARKRLEDEVGKTEKKWHGMGTGN